MNNLEWRYLGNTHLAFTESPEIADHADDVVQAGVGALVEQKSAEGAERIHDQASLDGTVQRGACKQW